MGCNKVCVGLVGALVVVMLVAVPTAIYVNRNNTGPKRTFSFDDFYNDTIRYQTYNLRWFSDTKYLHKTKDGNVYLHNVETMASSLYLSNSTFAQVDATDYTVSADRKYVCLESNFSKQWRHSFTASYSLYDMKTKAFITSTYIPEVTQLLLWAPVGNMMAYVWNYDIYIKPNATAEPIQVTNDGKHNQILNGIPDWSYEEEVFVSNEGMWWSPSAKYLAYVQINDTDVHAIEYSLYGNGQYPTTMTVPYPKAGSNIPKAKLFVIDVSNPSVRSEIVVPKSLRAGDHYLSSVTWVTDMRIAVQWLTRRQDHVLLQIYDYDGTNWNENTVCCISYKALSTEKELLKGPDFSNTSFLPTQGQYWQNRTYFHWLESQNGYVMSKVKRTVRIHHSFGLPDTSGRPFIWYLGLQWGLPRLNPPLNTATITSQL